MSVIEDREYYQNFIYKGI